MNIDKQNNNSTLLILVITVIFIFIILPYFDKKTHENMSNNDEIMVGETIQQNEIMVGETIQQNEIMVGETIQQNEIMVNKTIQQDKIMNYFPNAITNTKLIEYINEKKLNKDKTHFNLSICCDEINHEKSDLPDLCRELLGEVFQMGGLGGIPFAGITGLGATLNHVPTDGTLFILYGPHVGISLDGIIGNYNRYGILEQGHACGAAIGAYNTLNKLPSEQTLVNNEFDYQFNYIVQELSIHMNTINLITDENQKNIQIAESMYTIISKWINIFKEEFRKQNKVKKLILLGGIIINISKDKDNNLEDYFLIKNDEVVEIQ